MFNKHRVSLLCEFKCHYIYELKVSDSLAYRNMSFAAHIYQPALLKTLAYELTCQQDKSL